MSESNCLLECTMATGSRATGSQLPSSRRTQADPKGLAQLYLPTQEIPDFFRAYLNYYDDQIQRNQRHFRITFGICLALGLLVLMRLFSEFSIADDDEIGIFIIFGIFFALFLIGIPMFFSSRKNKAQKQRSKGQMLAKFFWHIQYDLHPDSGLKGIIDHRKHQDKHRYKTKTSPYSGAKKYYYKYPWAVLKFTLIDGSSVRLKCVDKLKEKSGSLVRFQEIQKGRVLPNDLLYQVETGQALNFRRDLCMNENDLKEHPETQAVKMVEAFKRFYGHLEQRKTPLKPEVGPSAEGEEEHQQETTPVEANAITPLDKVRTLLESSEIEFKWEPLGDGLELRFVPFGRSEPAVLWLELGEFKGERFVSLRLGIQGEGPEEIRLLRANPALAYGRFAYYTSPQTGRKKLSLIKTLLWETLDREELETAIVGLVELGGKLGEMKALPEKARAFRAERHPQWERLLLENALQGLSAEIEEVEKKFKLRLSLPGQRYQTVHVRFDRQDLQGNQLISLLSYCGQETAELYQTVLEENSQWSYGAVGLARLGNEEMFVVSDNQLAETADPPELKAAILQVADKADQLEALLSGGQDRY